jgi:hypothetical protein
MTKIKQPAGRFSGLGYSPKRVAGLQSRRLQRLRAGRFGAANRGKLLEGDARRAVVERLRQEGQIL